MTEIRHIVFDIGQVLIHYDPHAAYRELIPDDAEREAFLNEVCSHDWNVEQDRGRSWEDAEAEAIARHPDKEDLIRAFRGRWPMMVPYVYDDSVALLREVIAAGHDVTMLTNFSADTFKVAQELYPFLTESRGVTVSGEARVIKPDPRIYAIHTETFGLTPAATLFFDDNPANVVGARAFGWNAEQFRSPEQMRRDLERYGVLGLARAAAV